jgi:hypothetical protein
MSAPNSADRVRASRPRSGTGAKGLRGLLAAALAVGGLGGFAIGASAEETGAVSFPGTPLTVSVGPLGQCQSSYSPGNGNYFEPANPVGDCGLFLAFPKGGTGQPAGLQDTTWGFPGSAGPHLSTFEGGHEYLPVSQSTVTGSGTSASPYTQTTVYEVTTSEMREKHETGYALVTDTTTYVSGEAQFTSSYAVKNLTKGKLYFRAIYAGDLYVTGSDFGTGVYLGGPPAFIGGQNSQAGILGGFVQAAAPSPPWSAYQEGCWNETAIEAEGRCTVANAEDSGIWHIVRTSVESEHAFNDTIDPALIDNGAGVEWDQFRQEGLAAEAEQAFTVINRTGVPSGLKISPTNQTLTQGQTETISVSATNTANEPYAGKSVHYTVSGANPQEGAVTLNSAGQAQISYIGHNAGIDTINIYVDLGGTGTKTNSDPAATAQVTFVPLPPTPNSTYTVQSVKANPDGTVTITFVPTQSGTATLTVTVPTGTIARREAIAARHSKKCPKGQVRIKHRCRPPLTVSGSVSAPGTAGVPLTLSVKPSGKVLAALKKGKTVHLTATLTYKSALGGTPTVQTYSVTVKGKRKHHGKRH